MEPELGSVDFVGKSRTKKNVCSQTNGNLDCSQDSRADPFGWQSMVALLSLWKHWHGKIANEPNMGMKHIRTYSNSEI